MGELTFFLGIEVKQNNEGILISQEKYVKEMLKKFGFHDSKGFSTPVETRTKLHADLKGECVDEHLYRSMIGVMYLTASRPDIICLKSNPKRWLWYPKDELFDLRGFSDSDYGGYNMDRKSTTGRAQFLGNRLVSWQCKK
ncbi:hypothetical protein SSX86_030035 [Deinandra increscens subsp. villosa]|uniref:Reverse transcriptase Ty1/copia-type domain-containing protein n=1 Tax=Deinandra increscens subsp. villosa TaxID=3103831 RepID=A0AAP0GL54_9ASTR